MSASANARDAQRRARPARPPGRRPVRPARDGDGYAARRPSAVGDPLAWLLPDRPAERDHDEDDDGAADPAREDGAR